MEMTGSQNKLKAFIELMADYEILEACQNRNHGTVPAEVRMYVSCKIHMFARRGDTLLTINNFMKKM